MKYSLFIDESGDFHRSREWIVSGILCPYDKETAENYLRKTLGHLPQRCGLSSLKKMHLTDLRDERGHPAAVEIADSLFSSLHNSQYKWNLVVARNKTKFSLSDPERTYRLMLLDLIALAESTIPDNTKLSGFDIVIATRTDKNGDRMTTLSDLDEDVVAMISNALEAGIASRGMIDFVDSKGLEITTLQANKSWGLIVADFICNVSYNHFSHDESLLLTKLKEVGLLFEFQSFGEYQERRARIAERDGNYIDAIRRWASINYVTDNDVKQQSKILTQLFDKIITFGTVGPRSTLDAIIEHIWRDEELKGKYEQIYQISQRLEVALNHSYQNNHSPQFTPLLFRILNFMHLISNKMGDISNARELISKKKILEERIGISPEFFSLILDSQLYGIDTLENDLAMSDCLKLSKSHHSLVQLYKECWDLLFNKNTTEGFNSSRINIKSEMTLLRSQILSGDKIELDLALSRIDSLRKIIINNEDRKRLLNYEILANIKIENFIKSIIIGMNELDNSKDKFLIQHVLRSVVSGLLFDENQFKTYGIKLLSIMQNFSMPNNDHPVDLIWRDWGMLDFLLTGKNTVVLRYLKRSKKYLSEMPASTEVVKWLHFLLDLHVDFIKCKQVNNVDINKFHQLLSHDKVNSFDSSGIFHGDTREVLMLCRQVSPY